MIPIKKERVNYGRLQKSLERRKDRFLDTSPFSHSIGRYKKRARTLITAAGVLALMAFFVLLVWAVVLESTFLIASSIFGLIALFSALVALRGTPDYIRSQVAQQMLWTASATLEQIKEGGLDAKHAKAICERILPETQAIAIALTDTQKVLAYVGQFEREFPVGSDVKTPATKACLKTGEMQSFSFSKRQDIDIPTEDNKMFAFSRLVPCGIVVPLLVQGKTVGTLKFYYANHNDIDQSQYAIATGFGELLSTQLFILELDNQATLRAKAEIKALQFQINPHFLFNTLNTIASFVRTNPAKARELLRDFSSFYRGTLDNSKDSITLETELAQVHTYLVLEKARFGDERILLTENVDDTCKNVAISPFLIQPLVENAIRHGMAEARPLSITLTAQKQRNDLGIQVKDDGIGMDQTYADSLLQDETLFMEEGTYLTQLSEKPTVSSSHKEGAGQTGQVDRADHAGIALINIKQRVDAFSPNSGIGIVSRPDGGTAVTLVLAGIFDKSSQIS